MTAADELEDLLFKERAVLLQGHLRDLEALSHRKAALFHDVQNGDVPPTEQLNRLRHIAEKNSVLLAASGRGIMAALAQVLDAKTSKAQTFYGPKGERMKMISSAENLEQKL